MRSRILCFLVLLWILGTSAAHTATGNNLSKELILQNGILSLKNQDYDTARHLAQYLITDNPRDSDGYHLMAMALTAKKAYWDLIATVLSAEKNGVTSSILYERQAEAFFALGAIDASLMALTNMEKQWNEENTRR